MSFSHFFSLFKKNIIISKRTYILTSIELISPILVLLLFYLFKSLFKTESLYIQPDDIYINRNGTIIYNIKTIEDYNNIYYNPKDLTYQGFLYPCFDKSIALIGKNFPLELISRIKAGNWEIMGKINFTFFNTSNELIDLIEKDKENNNICFGISYEYNEINNTSKKKYKFKLHYPTSPYSINSLIPSTNIPNLDPFRTQPDFYSYKTYMKNGFLIVHKILYDYVLQKETNNTEAEINYRLIPQKYDKYLYNVLDNYLSILFGIFVLIAYAFPLSINIYRLIKEKENKSKEIMKIMGLNDLNYFLSYFVIYLIANIYYSSLNALIASKALNYLNYNFLFLFFFLYGIVIYSLIFFFQSFLEKTSISIILSLLIYITMFFLSLIFQSNAISKKLKIFFCIIFPPINMQLGINTFINFQINYKSMDNNSKNLDLKYNDFSLNNMYLIFFFNFCVYMFLGFYLQNILPKKYGISLPPYFIFTKSYWGFDNESNNKNIDYRKDNNFHIEILNDVINTKSFNDNNEQSINQKILCSSQLNSKSRNINNFFEKNKKYENYDNNKDVIRINNIKKSFGNNLILDNLSFELYKDEIFVLLGHNGAGKTVFLSILTGLIKNDSGAVYYNSKNILSSKNISDFRKLIGICPQEDILFPELTVEEHLNLFCNFKSVPHNDIPQEISSILTKLNLLDQKETKAGLLSGGQKRKLSIALALVGKSSIIFLDEPTSGMDIISRRNLWEILKKNISGKIIILTTHYMEEAAYLGNRIGILSGGKMICIGSPLFLIDKFSKNINLTLIKYESKTTKDNDNDNDNNNNIIKYIKDNFNNSNNTNNNINIEYEIYDKEIIFKIQNNNNINWSNFFNKLDNDIECNLFNIKTYTISMPTLEDVFINLSKKSKQKEINEYNNKFEFNNNILYNDDNYIKDNKDILIMIKLILIKRIYQIIREKKTFIIEVICPILLTLIGCLVGYIEFKEKNITFPFHLNQITNDTQILLYSIFNNNLNDYENIFNDIFINYSSENLNKIIYKEILYENFSYDNFYNKSTFFMRKHFEIKKNLEIKNYAYYILSNIDKIQNKYEFNCFIDITARQAAPIYPNFLLNNLVKYATENKELNIEIINEPLPLYDDHIKDELHKDEFMVLFFCSLAFSLIPSNFITVIIKEQEKNTKHLQIISGISLFIYWCFNFIFELIKYYIIGGICILLLYFFDFYKEYLYILYLEYGPSMISFTYLLSFIFHSEDNGQIFILLLNLIIGVLGGISLILMRLNEDLIDISKIIIHIFRFIPSFCFCFGYNQLFRLKDLFNVDGNYKISINFNNIFFWFSEKEKKNILSLDYVGTDCIYLACVTIFSITFLFFLEIFKYIKIFCQKKREVIIPILNNNNYSILVQNLIKYYYSKCCCCNKIYAVKGINFGLEYGEIFGFLGINGAGKTTTFKCLANEILPSDGNIFIENYDSRYFYKIKNSIGYCPQNDAFFEYLTVYENLEFFGLIKGAKKSKLELIINALLQQMNLIWFKNTLSVNLSGGNKRKLSVAISLICNPSIILLDEPSAGMDPEARRYMWRVLNNISLTRRKSSIIITTHSMEEAEILCKRIGILVTGEFKCIGSKDEIKDKYGYGFEINFQINIPDLNTIYNMFYVSEEDKDKNIYFNYLDECLRLYYLTKYKSQLKQGLFGNKILSEISKKGYIPFVKILLWIYYLKNALGMISLIKQYFNEIICIDYNENNFVFKIKRSKIKGEKSIGFLFGLIHDNKNRFNIGPFNLKYTSLEYIFNKFTKYSTDAYNINNYNDLNIEIDENILNSFLN